MAVRIRDARNARLDSVVCANHVKNVEERDHILMLTHCYEQGGSSKEGPKAQFWTGVNEYSFSARYWEGLAQMSATVRRLVEAGRRQISDWEAVVIPQKPGGKLKDRLD